MLIVQMLPTLHAVLIMESVHAQYYYILRSITSMCLKLVLSGALKACTLS
jgi:hypothetical protein